jgi:hypothetical protein
MKWSGWIEPMLCRVFRRPNLKPTELRQPRLSEPETQAQPPEEGRAAGIRTKNEAELRR